MHLQDQEHLEEAFEEVESLPAKKRRKALERNKTRLRLVSCSQTFLPADHTPKVHSFSAQYTEKRVWLHKTSLHQVMSKTEKKYIATHVVCPATSYGYGLTPRTGFASCVMPSSA